MTAPAKKPATYADLLALPEHVRAEIVAGELVVHPAPLPRHAKAAGALRRFIGGPYDDDDGFGGPGGWWILPDVDIDLGHSPPPEYYRPDLSGWRRQRLPNPADERPIAVVPDWICEVISPTNEAYDRVHKRRVYARAGVAYYWIVDPEARMLEALELREGHWVELGAYDDSAVERIAPFPEVELHVGRLFMPRG